MKRARSAAHQTLRQATADLHQALEARLDLPGRLASTRSYGELLHRYLAVLLPIERRLLEFEWPESMAIEARSKAPLILADLRALGVELCSRPQSVPELHLSSPSAAYGCLYVLEGATLGGRIIAKQVHRRLGYDAQRGAAFFAAYGEQTSVMWTSFLAALGDNVIATPDIERAVHGARETFSVMDLGLNSV